MPLWASFFEDVSLVEFMSCVLTSTPGGVTVDESVFVVVFYVC